MTETLIDIDDELLAEVATILGTTSIRDTVNAALADVLRVRAANAAARPIAPTPKFPESARNRLHDDLPR
jgi:Arc/MetJ family transcription regulator